MPITMNITNSQGVSIAGGKLKTDSMDGYQIIPKGSTAQFEDRVTAIVDPIVDDFEDTTFSDAVGTLNTKISDLITNIGTNYTTTNLLSDLIDAEFQDSVYINNYLGGFVTDASAGAIWGLNINANGAIAGIELGAMSTGGVTDVSYFKVVADNFAVYNSSGSTMLDPDTGEDMPVFFVGQDDEGANFVGFNGKAYFQDLLDKDSGQTIIDGGHITTDLINADEIIVGAGFGNTNLGYSATPPTNAIAATITGNPSYVLKNGDTYTDNVYNYEWYAVQQEWVATKKLIENEATARGSALADEQLARAQAVIDAKEDLAVSMGFIDQGNGAYAEMVDQYSRLGTTFIQGGFINTGLVQTDAILVTGSPTTLDSKLSSVDSSVSAAQGTADSALSAASTLAANTYYTGTTSIDGGKIKADTITLGALALGGTVAEGTFSIIINPSTGLWGGIYGKGSTVGLFGDGGTVGVKGVAEAGPLGIGLQGLGYTRGVDASGRIGGWFYGNDTGTSLHNHKGSGLVSTSVNGYGVFGEGGGGFSGVYGHSGGGAGITGVTDAYHYGVHGIAAGHPPPGTGTGGIGVGAEGYSWGIAASCYAADGGGVSATGGTIGVVSSGTVYGFWTSNASYLGGAVYPFTGAHMTLTQETTQKIGDIMVTIDAYGNSISQSYPMCETSSVTKDKRVIGVCSQVIEELSAMERYVSNLMDIVTDDMGVELSRSVKPEYQAIYDSLLADGYKVGFVNSIGEGMMNVCEIGGDIESGDYICSSIVPGKGMKQDDDLLHSYTAGKSLTNIVWSDLVVGTDCYLTTGTDGTDYKTKMIACTYHCG